MSSGTNLDRSTGLNPSINLWTFLVSLYMVSGSYLPRDRNHVSYSSTDKLPWLSLKNSARNFRCAVSGINCLLKASQNISQLMSVCRDLNIGRVDFHQCSAAPFSRNAANATLSEVVHSKNPYNFSISLIHSSTTTGCLTPRKDGGPSFSNCRNLSKSHPYPNQLLF